MSYIGFLLSSVLENGIKNASKSQEKGMYNFERSEQNNENAESNREVLDGKSRLAAWAADREHQPGGRLQ